MKIVRPFFFFAVLFLCIDRSFSGTAPLNLEWENKITSALKMRDTYYASVGIKSRETFDLLVSAKKSTIISKKLVLHRDDYNVWYQFLLGVDRLPTSVDDANARFRKALRLVRGSPGLAFVLAYEFYRIGEGDWASLAMDEVQRAMLVAGISSIPIINRGLIYLSQRGTLFTHPVNSNSLYKRSLVFDDESFWSTLLRGIKSKPVNIGKIFVSFWESSVLISKSWFLQLESLYYLYGFLRIAILFSVIGILLALSIETLPTAIHPVMTLFPAEVDVKLKYYLSLLILLSLLSLGFIPFVVLLLLLIWPFAKNRLLLVYVSVVIALWPIDSVISGAFTNTLSQSGSVGLFRSSLKHGASKELESYIAENLKKNDKNYLASLAASIFMLKKGNISSSIYHYKAAESIAPDDPMVLIIGGTVFARAKDYSTAKKYFERCIELYPRSAAAIFNLSQINVAQLEATNASRRVVQATSIDPDRINKFLADNSKFFEGNWPPNRMFILSDYTPSYFWKNVFPKYATEHQYAENLWGASFFGIPLKYSLFILPFFLFVAIRIRLSKTNTNIPHCSLCDAPMCKKCRAGAICKNCMEETGDTRNENLIKRVKQRIILRRRTKYKKTGAVLNIIMPGLGDIYSKRYLKIVGLVRYFITVVIFAGIYFLYTANYSIPVKNVYLLNYMISFVLIVYIVFSAFKSFKELMILYS